MLSKLENENGSTLIVVFGFLTVLFIMGFAIITASAAHLTAQKQQESRKAAFYMSESGIDELYVDIIEATNTLRAEAIIEAGAALQNEITKQLAAYDEFKFNGGIGAPPPLYNTDGSVNQDAALAYAEAEYISIFKTKFLAELSKTSPETPLIPLRVQTIDDIDKSYTAENGPVNGLVINDADFEALGFEADNTLTLPVFSFYFPERSGRVDTEKVSHKLLTVNITVTPPPYAALQLDQEVLKFDPNILWTKALTSDSILTATGGPVTINGNVYAKDGINVNGIVTVNGETVTGGAENDTSGQILFSSGSSLSINGNLYAKDIIVGNGINTVEMKVHKRDKSAFTPDSLDAAGSIDKISSTGDVVVKNNLELRGEKTQIEIENNFTGFMPPLDTDPLANSNTSAVIIDTDDLKSAGSHSKLTIGGNMAIMGIAYLEDDSGIGNRFSTGESIALKGNYNTYKNILQNVAGENFLSDFVDNFNINHNSAHPADEYAISFKNPLGLGLFVPYSFSGTDFSILDLANYFYHVSKMSKEPALTDETAATLGILKDVVDFDEKSGGKNVIDFDPDKYFSYGIAISNNEIYKSKAAAELDLEPISRSASAMYNKQLLNYGDLQNTAAQSISSLYTFTGSNVDDEKTYSIGSGIDIMEKVYSGAGNITINGGQYEIVKGVIVTRGNVTLNGTEAAPLNFRGVIIAEGNITINGKVTVTNDMAFIAKAMSLHGSGLGFKGRGSVLPTYSFKTEKLSSMTEEALAALNLAQEAAITQEDFVYTLTRDDTGLTDKYDTLKNVVKMSGWDVIDY